MHSLLHQSTLGRRTGLNPNSLALTHKLTLYGSISFFICSSFEIITSIRRLPTRHQLRTLIRTRETFSGTSHHQRTISGQADSCHYAKNIEEGFDKRTPELYYLTSVAPK